MRIVIPSAVIFYTLSEGVIASKLKLHRWVFALPLISLAVDSVLGLAETKELSFALGLTILVVWLTVLPGRLMRKVAEVPLSATVFCYYLLLNLFDSSTIPSFS
eukprot:gene35902-46611_t